MLEKFSNFLYFDAHFHLFDCIKLDSFDNDDKIRACSCAHSVKEFDIQQKYPNIIQSYGIHPQNVGSSDINLNLNFLEKLLENNKISAIGETGFDFYTNEFNSFKNLQEDAFNKQIDLAIFYNKPVVIHCRKANEKLFEYSSKLKKLPAVLFHSFMGPITEAQSLIKKNINCYFSFGKQIFNNNKKVISCVQNLPLENLLLETDAPFQTLKNEEKTYSSEIIKIYDGAYKIRYFTGNKKSYEEFCLQLQQNFHSLYKI